MSLGDYNYMAGALPIVTTVVGGVSSAISGFFGLKQTQAEVISTAINTLGDTQRADADYVQSSARAIEALYTNGPLLERLWRPLLMWIMIAMVIARWFGFIPPGIDHEEIMRIYDWIEIGLIGYMPLRSLDKWMKGFQIASVLKQLIKK